MTEMETALGVIARSFIQSKSNIKRFEELFAEDSKKCKYRHPTAFYCNCSHPKGDPDMANCLIDECPLGKEGSK